MTTHALHICELENDMKRLRSALSEGDQLADGQRREYRELMLRHEKAVGTALKKEDEMRRLVAEISSERCRMDVAKRDAQNAFGDELKKRDMEIASQERHAAKMHDDALFMMSRVQEEERKKATAEEKVKTLTAEYEALYKTNRNLSHRVQEVEGAAEGLRADFISYGREKQTLQQNLTDGKVVISNLLEETHRLQCDCVGLQAEVKHLKAEREKDDAKKKGVPRAVETVEIGPIRAKEDFHTLELRALTAEHAADRAAQRVILDQRNLEIAISDAARVTLELEEKCLLVEHVQVINQGLWTRLLDFTAFFSKAGGLVRKLSAQVPLYQNFLETHSQMDPVAIKSRVTTFMITLNEMCNSLVDTLSLSSVPAPVTRSCSRARPTASSEKRM